jgi:hypothetical protein
MPPVCWRRRRVTSRFLEHSMPARIPRASGARGRNGGAGCCINAPTRNTTSITSASVFNAPVRNGVPWPLLRSAVPPPSSLPMLVSARLTIRMSRVMRTNLSEASKSVTRARGSSVVTEAGTGGVNVVSRRDTVIPGKRRCGVGWRASSRRGRRVKCVESACVGDASGRGPMRLILGGRPASENSHSIGGRGSGLDRVNEHDKPRVGGKLE